MELINEPTNEFNKNDFFKCLCQHGKPINIKCVEVSEITKSKINNKPTIYLNMEILNQFDIIKKDANDKEIIINPLNQIVNLPYGLQETRQDNIYKVSNKSNLYELLNHALKENELIPENNTKGFNISLPEIQDNLIGIVFNVVSILETDTNYKPYYKLRVINENEI